MGTRIELWLATNNSSKLKEFKKILPENVIVKHKNNFILPEETGKTFVENANIKSKALFFHTKTWTLADDSGLVIRSLNGRPGIFSRRYAGQNATNEDNNKKVLEELNGLEDRSAYFITVLSLLTPSGEIHNFEGKLEGFIAKESRGEFGFGYDPIFIPDGSDKTLAQMESFEKNNLSHRYKAIKKLVKSFF